MSIWDIALLANPLTAPIAIGTRVIGTIVGDQASHQAQKVVDEQAPRIAGPYAEQAGHSFVKGALDELASQAGGLLQRGKDRLDVLGGAWDALQGFRVLVGLGGGS